MDALIAMTFTQQELGALGMACQCLLGMVSLPEFPHGEDYPEVLGEIRRRLLEILVDLEASREGR